MSKSLGASGVGRCCIIDEISGVSNILIEELTQIKKEYLDLDPASE